MITGSAVIPRAIAAFGRERGKRGPYCSAAVPVPDALGILENAEIAR